MDKIRWGVLSTAKIGREKVIPATQRSQFGVVTAIASRDLARAQSGRGRAGHRESRTARIKSCLPIAMSTPSTFRCPIICTSAGRSGHWKTGKHVLCEKPIGLSVAEAEQLAGAAAAHPKLKVMEAFMYRFHPQWQTARQMVREGRIGQLRTIHTLFPISTTTRKTSATSAISAAAR